MTRRRKQPGPAENIGPGCRDILQIKVWRTGIRPMVWRRVLVPAAITLRELHGVLQVAMGWEGIHLFQFRLRAACYGSAELSADLNIPWRHEVRIENQLSPVTAKELPACIGGGRACPPEDCGGPEGYMAGLDEAASLSALEDIDIMMEVLRAAVLERHPEVLERSRVRERARGRPFSRRRHAGDWRTAAPSDGCRCGARAVELTPAGSALPAACRACPRGS
jgi:hypothetical protein